MGSKGKDSKNHVVTEGRMEYLTNINWDVMSDYMSTGINRDMMLIGGVVGLFALFWCFMIFYAIYLTISSSSKGKDSFDESQELMESAQGRCV